MIILQYMKVEDDFLTIQIPEEWFTGNDISFYKDGL